MSNPSSNELSLLKPRFAHNWRETHYDTVIVKKKNLVEKTASLHDIDSKDVAAFKSVDSPISPSRVTLSVEALMEKDSQLGSLAPVTDQLFWSLLLAFLSSPSSAVSVREEEEDSCPGLRRGMPACNTAWHAQLKNGCALMVDGTVLHLLHMLMKDYELTLALLKNKGVFEFEFEKPAIRRAGRDQQSVARPLCVGAAENHQSVALKSNSLTVAGPAYPAHNPELLVVVHILQWWRQFLLKSGALQRPGDPTKFSFDIQQVLGHSNPADQLTCCFAPLPAPSTGETRQHSHSQATTYHHCVGWGYARQRRLMGHSYARPPCGTRN